MTTRSALPLLLIEAFAPTLHRGNGATVVALEAPVSSAWMQAVAASLKQSETAFVLPWGDGWAIRWFTPTCEVALCGHATLAATLALGHWGSLKPGESTVFQSRSGPLPVSLAAHVPGAAAGPLATIQLPTFPLEPIATLPALEAPLQQALGRAPEQVWSSSLGYTVALVEDRVDLRALDGFAEKVPEPCRGGLVVMQAMPPSAGPESAIEGRPADYQLRFFAPGLGIPEDPVTGSAHALVAPYWLQRLTQGQVRGWQASARGGGLVCEPAEPGSIRLRGPGQILLEGKLAWQEQSCDPESWAQRFPATSG